MKKSQFIVLEIITAILFVVFLIPFYILVINSFKPEYALLENPLSVSGMFEIGFDNYKALFSSTSVDIQGAFITSAGITLVSLLLIIIFSSMTAWVLVRNKSFISKTVFLMLISAMVIPFQVVMLPLIKTLASITNITGISTIGEPWVLVFAYVAFQSSLSVFLYHGFIKSIPLELEEAAKIDGCNTFQIYFYIILPILKPITVTVLILNGIWIWNDFLLPQMLIGGGKYQTLPMAVQQMASQSYGTNYEVILPAAVITILPIVVAFLLGQKHIVKGMVDGSIK